MLAAIFVAVVPFRSYSMDISLVHLDITRPLRSIFATSFVAVEPNNINVVPRCLMPLHKLHRLGSVRAASQSTLVHSIAGSNDRRRRFSGSDCGGSCRCISFNFGGDDALVIVIVIIGQVYINNLDPLPRPLRFPQRHYSILLALRALANPFPAAVVVVQDPITHKALEHILRFTPARFEAK